MSIRCGSCRGTHEHSSEVKACYERGPDGLDSPSVAEGGSLREEPPSPDLEAEGPEVNGPTEAERLASGTSSSSPKSSNDDAGVTEPQRDAPTEAERLKDRGGGPRVPPERRGCPVCSGDTNLDDVPKNTRPLEACPSCRADMKRCGEGHGSWQVTFCPRRCQASRRIQGSSGRKAAAPQSPKPPKAGPNTYCPYCDDLGRRGGTNRRRGGRGGRVVKYCRRHSKYT